MTLERRIAAAFAMDDEAWARHANPWSAWTRLSVLPLLLLALWSRVWLGWGSLVPIGAALFWTWWNPRAFAPPRTTESWAAKGVLGERIWLERDRVPVPERHRGLPSVLNAVGAVGLCFSLWGAIALRVWPAAFGVAVVYFSKLWFLDRMVWLYEDMASDRPGAARGTRGGSATGA